MKHDLHARANLLALAAIAMWGSLASLGVALSHVPPFLLTGLSLMVGGLIALPLSGFRLVAWRVPLPTLALGVYGLFGYHFLLFVGLQNAPPVQANLVNYLWPLLIVVLAPVLLPGLAMRWQHIVAGLIGFAGAAMVILAGVDGGADSGAHVPAGLQSDWLWGYLAAAVAAFIWSTYSLLTRRVPHFDTAAIGTFAWISGLLALLCHALMEPNVDLSLRDWALIGLMGLGPLGGSFFLWDKALKIGDARHIGLLSYLTPLLSTSLLLWVSGRALTWPVALAGVLIVGAAWLGTRVR
ncbi:DMT family transporter [Rhodoferax sp.]|uniref:DMT family transporter n=1 Tax=Rhodoferax sp. TaxID=50421 RepID=UPI00262EBA54|nr:DMT family transporter [Rhodoferax sp.]MDD3935720.1 DMT family transporter [Rhodoferax sp.]